MPELETSPQLNPQLGPQIPEARAPRRANPLLASFAALVALLIFNALFTPNFLTLQTLNVNLTQVSTIVIVGVAMTLVIATGGIDLSVGSLMAISGAIAPMIFLNPPFGNPGFGVLLAFIVPVLVAGAFGAFNGMLITRYRIQPIIATLILFIAGRGIAQVMTNGNLQSFRNEAFGYIGLGRPLGIPFQVILMFAIVALFAWLMRSSVFGRYLLAVGGNESASRLSGIPVSSLKTLVYIISGLLSGLAGLIVIAINSSSDANQVGLNMELDAIAGAFGAFNGMLITRYRIQPIIATLVLFIAGRGIAQVITNGNLQSFRNEAFGYIGLGRPFGIPFQVILMFATVALFAWLMRSSVFGRYVLAVGGNESASRLSGIPVSSVKTLVYIICGLLSGLAGLIVIAINSSSDANQVGLNMELDAIAAVAVGGTPLTGGQANIVGTLLGALIIQVIRYTLLAKGVPDAAALVVKAFIIIAAVYLQRSKTS